MATNTARTKDAGNAPEARPEGGAGWVDSVIERTLAAKGARDGAGGGARDASPDASQAASRAVLAHGHRLVLDREDGAGRAARVTLTAADGRPVLHLDLTGGTPVVALPDEDLSLELKGRLKVTARSIDLAARRGNVNIRANDDVRIDGERVRLNG